MATQIARQSDQPFFKPPREFKKRDARNMPIGPRTERRQKENKDLNKLNIRHCEIGLPGCVRNIMLTWAHQTKSRFLITKKDWQSAAKCCLPCHILLDQMSHKEMARLVSEAIKRRKKT